MCIRDRYNVGYQHFLAVGQEAGFFEKFIYGFLACLLYTSWSLKGGEAKEYTPVSFYKEFLGNDLTNNYVMLMNDPSREFYKCYRCV